MKKQFHKDVIKVKEEKKKTKVYSNETCKNIHFDMHIDCFQLFAIYCLPDG